MHTGYPPHGLLVIVRGSMEISESMITRMQDLAKEQGEEISRQQAYEAGFNLIGVFEILLKVDIRLHPENYKRKTTE